MKLKIVTIIVVLIIVVFFNPYVYKNHVRPILFQSEESRYTEVSFEYRPDMYIGKYMNGIVMYDGIRLINLDDRGREIFVSTIRADNFKVDTNSEYIYILDRIQKRIHRVNNRGEVIGDIRPEKNIVSFMSFKDGRVIVHYNTDVKAEGIQIFDKDGNIIKDISYPKSSINIIKEDESSGGFIVSALKRDESSITNSIFYYNHRMDAVYVNEIENSIFIDLEMIGSRLFLMDVDFVSLRDKNFQELRRLTPENNFMDISVSDIDVAFLDGKRKVKIMDMDGNLIEENNYKNDIIFLERMNNELIVASRDEIFFKNETIELSRDIIRVVPLKDKIAIFFRGGMKIIDI